MTSLVRFVFILYLGLSVSFSKLFAKTTITKGNQQPGDDIHRSQLVIKMMVLPPRAMLSSVPPSLLVKTLYRPGVQQWTSEPLKALQLLPKQPQNTEQVSIRSQMPQQLQDPRELPSSAQQLTLVHQERPMMLLVRESRHMPMLQQPIVQEQTPLQQQNLGPLRGIVLEVAPVWRQMLSKQKVTKPVQRPVLHQESTKEQELFDGQWKQALNLIEFPTMTMHLKRVKRMDLPKNETLNQSSPSNNSEVPTNSLQP